MSQVETKPITLRRNRRMIALLFFLLAVVTWKMLPVNPPGVIPPGWQANVEPILPGMLGVWTEKIFSRVSSIATKHRFIYFRKNEKIVMTPETMRWIVSHRRLRQLWIDGCDMNGVNLSELRKLKYVESILILSTQLKDASFSSIADMKSLTTLIIKETDLSDEQLKTLTMSESIRSLTLDSNRLTDNAIKDLASMKSLKRLSITGGFITSQGISAFKKARPNVTVVRNYSLPAFSR